MTGRLARAALGVAVAVSSLALLGGPSIGVASSLTPFAQPVPDCNTPNSSGGVGILETPADNNGASGQWLTKTGTGYNAGGTSYNFTVTSQRSAAATFSELTDCAYSVINGNPSTATYNENISPINFTYNSATHTWTANFSESVTLLQNGQPDQICDRVQVKGTDGTAFTDYSNLVQSSPAGSTSYPGAATSCSPPNNLPEAPATGLLAVAGLGVAGAAVYVWRRRQQPVVTTTEDE